MYSQPFDAISHDGYGLARETAATRARSATPVVLHVSDLETARKFYFDLLGFVPAEGYGYSDNRLVLVSPMLAHGFRSIVLTRDPLAATSHGLILELESSSELLDRYMLARLLGARTTPLISRGRSLSVTVCDPEGNEVELCARAALREEAATTGTRWGRAFGCDRTSPTRHGRGQAESECEAKPDGSLAWFDSLCGREDRGE